MYIYIERERERDTCIREIGRKGRRLLVHLEGARVVRDDEGALGPQSFFAHFAHFRYSRSRVSPTAVIQGTRGHRAPIFDTFDAVYVIHEAIMVDTFKQLFEGA